jgi:hypothetical protein
MEKTILYQNKNWHHPFYRFWDFISIDRRFEHFCFQKMEFISQNI